MALPDPSIARAGTYRLIGQGACGKVSYTLDNLGREVAVKEAFPGHPECVERFAKEVRIHARLSHPNIIKVYHLETDPQTQTQSLICEYANGGSLADHLRDHGPMPEPQAVRVALDLCAALEEVWRQRIVHRDLKPANILLCTDGQGQITAKLTDFGVARDLARQPTTQRGGAHPGTPEYMAPEQADITRPVDVRTDLYALGICLWEMLTTTSYKLVTASGPPDLRTHNPQASPGIAEVIAHAVQPAPADRYQTPQELAAALRDVLHGRPLSAPPTIHLPGRPAGPPHLLVPGRPGRSAQWWALVLPILALVGGGFWLWSTRWRVAERPDVATVGQLWIYTREAESPDAATVGETLARSAASNTQVHGQFGTKPAYGSWPAHPGSVQYDNISIPQSGRLYLSVHYSKHSPETAPILVFLDAEPEPRATLHPLDQGDWNQFASTGPIDLGMVQAGVHTLRFATSGQAFGVADLDRFTLAPQP